MTDEEVAEIQDWLQQSSISEVCPPNEEYPYFSNYPAFGKATDVFDCVCYF